MAIARILIVEDECVIAEDIRRQWLQLNYEIVGMTTAGEKALPLAEALRPDLILMDIALAGSIDGFEAGRLLEQSLGSTIIYVTSNPRASQLPHSIQKPFTKAALASGVAHALASRSNDRHLQGH